MNIPVLIANILAFLAFLIHSYFGDKDLQTLEPSSEEIPKKREVWTMIRCGWHWISFDLLFASIGLAIINFTDVLANEKQLLQILATYFLGYSIVWIVVILFSKKFPNPFVKLGQWILLSIIGGLIYLGTV